MIIPATYPIGIIRIVIIPLLGASWKSPMSGGYNWKNQLYMADFPLTCLIPGGVFTISKVPIGMGNH